MFTATKIAVCLRGLRPVMFDRYAGDNRTQLEPLEKLYLDESGNVGLPSENIMSFLSAQNTESATKRLIGKSWRSTAKAALSFVNINPEWIPILNNGKPIHKDSKQVTIHNAVARLKDGVPNPKSRPVVHLPWSLEFVVTLYSNPDLSEPTLKRIFDEGGMCIGLGTYRGVYGKFIVEKWEKIKG